MIFNQSPRLAPFSLLALVMSTVLVAGVPPMSPVAAEITAAVAACPVGSSLIETVPAPATPTCYQTFTTSGTFTPPEGVTAVDVLVVGGGGGGAQGGVVGGQVLSGGGGGGGAVTLQEDAGVSGVVTVTIGAGGAGGVVDCTPGCPGTGAAGDDGGQSSFGITIAVTAAGGTGGSGGAAGPVAGDGGASGSNAGGSDTVTDFGLGGAFFSGGGGGGGAGGAGGAATTPNAVCHTGDEDPTDGATNWMCGGDGGKGLLPTGGDFTSDFWTWLNQLSVTTYGFGPGGAGAVVGLWRDTGTAPSTYFASGRGVDLTSTPLARGVVANGADAWSLIFSAGAPPVPDRSSSVAFGWDNTTYGGGGSGGTGAGDTGAGNRGSAGTAGIVIVTFPAGEAPDGPVTGVDGEPMTLVFNAVAAGDRSAVLLGEEFIDDGTSGPEETVRVRVDWGDGTVEDVTSVGFKFHQWTTPGEKTVNIWPLFADASGSDTGPWLTLYGGDRTSVSGGASLWESLGETRDLDDPDLARLIQVVSFGDLGITSLRNAFSRHHDLVEVPNTLPSSVTDLGFAFYRTTSINDPDISVWDVGNVTDMESLFENADLFDQPLNGWDVSNVTNMSDMFEDAVAFNQDLDQWDVLSVTNMNNMFENATLFNGNIAAWKDKVFQVVDFADFLKEAVSFAQDLPDWDVSGANDLDSFFEDATLFNGSLAGWVFDTDTLADIDMSNFFEGAILFNQPLSSWVTTGFGDMSDMFYDAAVFDQDLSGWNVSNVHNMNDLFRGAAMFDQDLSRWNVSNVDNMSSMFRGAAVFDQDLSGWDVLNVTDMSSMFRGAVMFDQELSAWDVSNVDNMSSMFNLASAFDRSLGDWTLNANVNLGSMLNSSGMSTSCYDATLNGWAAGPEVTERGLGADGVLYTAAGAIGRTALTDTRGWTITDAGPSTELAGNCMTEEIVVMVAPVETQTIEYGDDPDLSFTDDLPEDVEWITEPTCAVYLEDLEVASSALTEVTEGPVPAGTYVIQCGGGELPAGYSADFETTGTLVVDKVQAIVTYTGTSGVVPSGGLVTLSATLSPADCTGDIVYLVNGESPPGSYADGIYEIEVNYPGDENCEPATVYAIVVVGGATAASNGGGHYNVSGAGKINFGYTVQVNKSRTGSTQVSGQILWNSQNGKFRFKGVITGFVKTTTDCSPGAICGRIVGTGSLRVRDESGEWVVVSSSMTFKASATDAGTVSVCSGGRKRTCTTVNRADLFGLDILGTTLVGEQAAPAGGWPTPVQLSGGNILIK